VLRRHGVGRAFLDGPVPPRVGRDDRLDAGVLVLVAARLAAGEAVSFPDPPGRDAGGLPVAIRA
jgi:predicted RNase H-like nuclease